MGELRDPDFAARLERACIDHPHCPTDLYRGKQKWLREELSALDQGFSASAEAIRKWFAGESRPRPKMMRAVAKVLNVDEAWLSLGIMPDMTQTEKKKRSRTAEGGALLLAGLIQISGGNSTFPSPGDADREDLLAIINGDAVEIDAPLARTLQTGLHLFTIKRGYEYRKVVGVVPRGFGAKMILINSRLIDSGERRGDYTEIEVSESDGRFSIGSVRLPEVTSLDMLASN